mgnify:FL=1
MSAVPKKIKKFKQLQKRNKKVLRHSNDYSLWRQMVVSRDNYVCQKCGKEGSSEAHHIFDYNTNEALRLNIDSGITLCHKCHTEYHAQYGDNINIDTLQEFFAQSVPMKKYLVTLSTQVEFEAEDRGDLGYMIDDLIREERFQGFDWDYNVKEE